MIHAAKVTSTAPLEVQLGTDTGPTAASRKDSDLPVLSIGDDVLVAFIDRKLHVLMKVVAA